MISLTACRNKGYSGSAGGLSTLKITPTAESQLGVPVKVTGGLLEAQCNQRDNDVL